jgi:hypothetical protein
MALTCFVIVDLAAENDFKMFVFTRKTCFMTPIGTYFEIVTF